MRNSGLLALGVLGLAAGAAFAGAAKRREREQRDKVPGGAGVFVKPSEIPSADRVLQFPEGLGEAKRDDLARAIQACDIEMLDALIEELDPVDLDGETDPNASQTFLDWHADLVVFSGACKAGFRA